MCAPKSLGRSRSRLTFSLPPLGPPCPKRRSQGPICRLASVQRVFLNTHYLTVLSSLLSSFCAPAPLFIEPPEPSALLSVTTAIVAFLTPSPIDPTFRCPFRENLPPPEMLSLDGLDENIGPIAPYLLLRAAQISSPQNRLFFREIVRRQCRRPGSIRSPRWVFPLSQEISLEVVSFLRTLFLPSLPADAPPQGSVARLPLAFLSPLLRRPVRLCCLRMNWSALSLSSY